MEQDKLTLVAEEGASLSSGSLRLYALPYGCLDLYNYDPLNKRAAVGTGILHKHPGLPGRGGGKECGLHYYQQLPLQ